MTPNDITAGETWAAKFRTTRMLGTDGKPVVNLKVGETAQGPGNWESVGIIVNIACYIACHIASYCSSAI